MPQNSVEEALQNPLIVQKILKNVETYDLLNCRLVTNTNWCDLSTEILRRRKNLQISYTHFETESKKFQGHDDDQDHWKKPGFFSDSAKNLWSLKSFTEMIKQSPKKHLICGRFKFSGGFLEESKDFEQFIQMCGDQIVDLKLDLLTRKNATYILETLGQTLMQTPNLESLTIDKVSLGWSLTTRLFHRKIRPGFQLPLLTSIQIGENVCSDLNFLNDLKAAAPNLQIFERITERPGNSSALYFSLKEYSIEYFEKLARSRPRFRSILVDLQHIKKISASPQVKPNILEDRVAAALSKILHASRPTLETLHGVEELGQLPHFKIPALPRVRLLTLEIYNRGCPLADLNFAASFPRLNRVKVSLKRLSIESTQKIGLDTRADDLTLSDQLDLLVDLQHKGTTSTTFVTYLEIWPESFNLPPVFVQQLGQTFPMVQNLELYDLRNFPELAPKIWRNFPKLKCLTAKIHISKICTISRVQEALGCLPGPPCHLKLHRHKISISTDTNPYKSTTYSAMEMGQNLAPSKKSPSISDLRELKSVQLDFRATCDESRQLLLDSDGLCQIRLGLNKLLPMTAICVYKMTFDQKV